MEHDAVVKLLWTGGWDSTYRLLDLLLVRGKPVRPYYIIDSDRRSTGLEIRAMRRIKRMLIETHPETKRLLLPTRFEELHDIKPNKNITESFQELRRAYPLGSQYDWLARFADERGIHDLELCIHVDDKAHKVLEPAVRRIGSTDDNCFVIREGVQDSAEYSVFRFFRFPCFELSKLDMERLSTQAGFRDLMELTWFCHRPRANGTACGCCAPCRFTIEEGLGRRVPLLSRIRYRISPGRVARSVLMRFRATRILIGKVRKEPEHSQG